tara:strand:+ start:9838 stop:11367 length:1530 start_codon:yes stop_codon:yes gene_type:complete
MHLIFTASADNYITNKIISTTLSASDANVGQASTLDLFKLYDETLFSGFTGSYSAPTEISRLLVKFNIDSISSSISPYAELNGFKAYLSLKDINGSQIAPSKFNVAVYPLSKSWDEGRGSDIYSFNDLDQSNWMTASYSTSGYDLWHSGGASSLGYLNSDDIDIIGSGSIAGSQVDFSGTQYFTEGHEDLIIDVTTAVSATMAGFMDDHGFLIAFSGSEETDAKSRFVKRFASRHARNEYLRPSLLIRYKDNVNDQRQNMFFNTSGSIFVENKVRGVGAYFISGSNEAVLNTADSMVAIIHSSSFAITASAGVYHPAGKIIPGFYTASFAIDRFSAETLASSDSVYDHVAASGSLVMYERWMDENELYTYYTGSFTVKSPKSSSSETMPRYVVKIKNLSHSYNKNETHKLELHVRDENKIYKPVRTSLGLQSLKFEEAYYQVKDIRTGDILVPFVKESNGTRISADQSGMYFNLSTANWPKERSYTVDILVVENGKDNIYKTGQTFKVV